MKRNDGPLNDYLEALKYKLNALAINVDVLDPPQRKSFSDALDELNRLAPKDETPVWRIAAERIRGDRVALMKLLLAQTNGKDDDVCFFLFSSCVRLPPTPYCGPC